MLIHDNLLLRIANTCPAPPLSDKSVRKLA
jgi:hypothetical protein